jgi:glycosyltransferase involved in cell wall biosynthesis
MACGCPTICSSRSSGPELVEHGRDGLLVDPDDREGIASAILTLLDNEPLASQLGKAGQKKVRERFALPAVLDQIEDFYRHCISGFQAKAA